MLNKLQNWFEQRFTEAEQNHQLTVEVASAALLFEIIRADHLITDEELTLMRSLLAQDGDLTETELDELISSARQEAESSLDLVRFTRIINEEYDHSQKRELLERLWRLAYADKHLAGDEDYAIRKIADLLYLNHSDFIQTKLKITENSQ